MNISFDSNSKDMNFITMHIKLILIKWRKKFNSREKTSTKNVIYIDYLGHYSKVIPTAGPLPD